MWVSDPFDGNAMIDEAIMKIETDHTKNQRGIKMPRGGTGAGGRPTKYGEPTVNLAVRVPVRLKEKLLAAASAEGKTVSEVLVEIIEAMPAP